MAKVQFLVVHHSASNPETTVEEIARWHTEERGWRAIGYHLLLRQEQDLSVQLYTGRSHDDNDTLDSWEYGAHVGGHNRYSYGICTIGNWSLDPMPPEMLEGLVLLLASLCLKWELDPEAAIRGHREMPGASTECPGLLVDMGEMREAVAEKVDRLREINDTEGDPIV